jgi:hypothetical protein
MSAVELILLLNSSGVLAGGLGLLKWGLRTERRLIILEVKNGITNQ